MTATEAQAKIFRRPLWRARSRRLSLAVEIAVIALGFLEAIVGAGVEYPTNEVVGFSSSAAGVALAALGFYLVMSEGLGRSMREDFITLSSWLESLLTNRESPLISRVDTLRNGILGDKEQEVGSDHPLSLEIASLKRRLAKIEESQGREMEALRATLSGEVDRISQILSAMEAKQNASLQSELSSFGQKQNQAIQKELAVLSEDIERLPTHSSLKELEREVSSISKRVRRIEEWNE